MRLTVDNLDGVGAVDYSGYVLSSDPVEVVRAMGDRATLRAGLVLGPGVERQVPLRPVRGARVVAAADDGTVLFAGSAVAVAAAQVVGAAAAGPVYRMDLRAVSDVDVLTRQAVRMVHMVGEGETALKVGAASTTRVRELAADVTVSGGLEPAAYVNEYFTGDGTTASFTLTETPYGATKVLIEDGFDGPRLTGSGGPSGVATGASVAGSASAVWSVTDAGGHLALGGGGLQVTGGTGQDGQTVLQALVQVELGGSLIVEATGVQMDGAAAQAGVLCGLYGGAVLRAACVAGWSVAQSGGTTTVTPLVEGATVGTAWTVAAGHLYTLRIRLWSAEVERVLPSFTSYAEGVLERFGGGLVDAGLQVVFEALDEGVSSNTPVTVLYQGAIASSVAVAEFAAVNALALTGSVRTCKVQRKAAVWVTGVTSSGEGALLLGSANTGVDAELTGSSSSGGTLTFFAGRIPAAGELVRVRYRVKQRAVARLQDAARMASADGMGFGLAECSQWSGRVLDGKVLGGTGRSSADCAAAAQAVLGFASSRAAGLAGSLGWTAGTARTTGPLAAVLGGSSVGVGGVDVFPGDVVMRPDAGMATAWLVRRVVVTGTAASPECLKYEAALENDWARGLAAAGSDGVSAALELEEGVAVDAVVPVVATMGPVAVLADLTGLTVTSESGTSMQVDAGADAPAGGGFEVRRNDWTFGFASEGTADPELVLRSPVRSFSIPRTAVGERFYVRMYDASAVPVYSRWSSVVILRTPLG